MTHHIIMSEEGNSLLSESEETIGAGDELLKSFEKRWSSKFQGRRLERRTFALSAFAFISVLANVILVISLYRCRQCTLPLSGLGLEIDVQLGPTKFALADDVVALDQFWNGLNTWVGAVALPKDRHYGTSMDFPWDESKAVYNLNSFHTLHCLQMIYQNIRELQQGKDHHHSFAHSVHCLDVIKSDTLCNADDTPVSFVFHPIKETEPPPKQRCRDWSKLLDFANENSACFKRWPRSDPRWNTTEAFVHCPDNSPYWPAINEYKMQKLGGGE